MNRNHPIYTLRKSADEIATHFRITDAVQQFNAPEESYPGSPGLVVREQNGMRVLQPVTWGFPLRLKTMKPESKPKPVNNIADVSKSMWIGLARKPEGRCLIPATGFAEAEGPKGKMTRTWFGVKDQPIFAWAGLRRQSAEWGDVYSGMMTDCNEAIRPVHNRMPVLLMPDGYDRFLHGSFEDVLTFQSRCFPDDLITIDRTTELWRRSSSDTPAASAGPLFCCLTAFRNQRRSASHTPSERDPATRRRARRASATRPR